MVLVILLQILTHKLKIYQNHQEDNIKEEKNDDPKYLLEQLEEIQEDYEETERKNENLIKNSNYSDVLNKYDLKIYLLI
nr:hypothetical protein [Mycoplasmopsis bovis]